MLRKENLDLHACKQVIADVVGMTTVREALTAALDAEIANELRDLRSAAGLGDAVGAALIEGKLRALSGFLLMLDSFSKGYSPSRE